MTSKFALVIANTEYQDASFAKLTAPGKDADEFAQVLRDLAAFDDVQVLLNEGEGKTRRSIARFFAERKRDDLLLLYFSGHGVRNEVGQLFLAANDTEINILEASGIPAEFVTQSMNNSRSQRQLLILDCCNSGAFAYGTKSASAVGKSMGIASAFEGSGFGRVVLTATDATQYAWEGDKVIGDTQKSVFTHFLIEGLKGEADRDGDGRINVDELYDYTFEQVVRRTPKQTPGKWSYKQQGDIILRENLKPRDVKPAPLPNELLELLSHPNSSVRKVGIQDLITLLDGKHLGLARGAEEKLREIAENDDSSTFRRIASEALIARGLTLEQPALTSVEIPKEQHKEENHALKTEGRVEGKIEKPRVIPLQESPSPKKTVVTEEAQKRASSQQKKIVPQPNLRLLGLGAVGFFFLVLCIAGGLWASNTLLANTINPSSTPPKNLSATSTNQPNVTSTDSAFANLGQIATAFAQIATANASTLSSVEQQRATLMAAATNLESFRGNQETGSDGMTLLYVPAGEFTMGSDSYDAEKPIHTVTLDAFWIDQTEVTNVMYAECITDGGCTPPSSTSSYTRDNYYGNSEFKDYPVIYVDWNQANAYCSWAGRELPTEAQWEKAARGITANIYPWGDTFDGSLVNFCDTNCSFDWADKNSDDGYPDTAPVGSYSNGASPYGALDMAGNVWEWVEDWYDAYSGNTESNSSYGTTYRVLRGGSWNGNDNDVRSANRYRDDPTNTGSSIGFRCSRSP